VAEAVGPVLPRDRHRTAHQVLGLMSAAAAAGDSDGGAELGGPAAARHTAAPTGARAAAASLGPSPVRKPQVGGGGFGASRGAAATHDEGAWHGTAAAAGVAPSQRPRAAAAAAAAPVAADGEGRARFSPSRTAAGPSSRVAFGSSYRSPGGPGGGGPARRGQAAAAGAAAPAEGTDASEVGAGGAAGAAFSGATGSPRAAPIFGHPSSYLLLGLPSPDAAGLGAEAPNSGYGGAFGSPSPHGAGFAVGGGGHRGGDDALAPGLRSAIQELRDIAPA